jgi:multisubunit Na+/H+ antiporter MnhF subunit
MNLWLWGATCLLLCLVPCGIVIVRGELMDKVVGLGTAGGVSVLALLLLAVGADRPSLIDAALMLEVLACPCSLLFIHFSEHWL